MSRKKWFSSQVRKGSQPQTTPSTEKHLYTLSAGSSSPRSAQLPWDHASWFKAIYSFCTLSNFSVFSLQRPKEPTFHVFSFWTKSRKTTLRDLVKRVWECPWVVRSCRDAGSRNRNSPSRTRLMVEKLILLSSPPRAPIQSMLWSATSLYWRNTSFSRQQTAWNPGSCQLSNCRTFLTVNNYLVSLWLTFLS